MTLSIIHHDSKQLNSTVYLCIGCALRATYVSKNAVHILQKRYLEKFYPIPFQLIRHKVPTVEPPPHSDALIKESFLYWSCQYTDTDFILRCIIRPRRELRNMKCCNGLNFRKLDRYARLNKFIRWWSQYFSFLIISSWTTAEATFHFLYRFTNDWL